MLKSDENEQNRSEKMSRNLLKLIELGTKVLEKMEKREENRRNISEGLVLLFFVTAYFIKLLGGDYVYYQ